MIQQHIIVVLLMSAALLASCATGVRVHPESATVSVSFAKKDVRVNDPIGISLKIEPKFAPGVVLGEEHQVPFTMDAKRHAITTAAALHGVTGMFIIATAEPFTIVTPGFINKAMPPVRTAFSIERIAGSVTQEIECVPVFSLTLGAVAYTNFDVAVAPLEAGIDGIIGANLLNAHPITVDYRRHCLVFDLPADLATWYSARYANQNGVPTTTLVVNGMELPCVLDSRVPQSALPRALYKGKLRETQAGKPPETDPDSIMLGNVSIKAGMTFMLAGGTTAILGLDFLEKHVVAIDPQLHTILFRPRPN